MWGTSCSLPRPGVGLGAFLPWPMLLCDVPTAAADLLITDGRPLAEAPRASERGGGGRREVVVRAVTPAEYWAMAVGNSYP